MVMTTPALDALFDAHPDARVTLLTSPEGRVVLRGFDPRIEDVWVYPRRDLASLLGRRALRRAIEHAAFDSVYIFETNPKFLGLVQRSDARVFALAAAPGSTPRHYALRCLELVSPGALPRPVRLPVSGEARARAAAVFAAAGIDPGERLVGVHPGFSGQARWVGKQRVKQNKSWPVASWGELAKRLAAMGARGDAPLRVVADVLPEERALGEAVSAASGGHLTLLAPPPDFERYKASIERMALFVSPDTGPMHVAAAVGTPVVALFAGKDPNDCGPYGDPLRRRVLRAEDEASDGIRGLAAISVARVVEACADLLAGRPGSGSTKR
jgi:ADP-heptose:LPS heptosyltransferase